MAAIVKMRHTGSVGRLKFCASELDAGFNTGAGKKLSGYTGGSLTAASIGATERLLPAGGTVAMCAATERAFLFAAIAHRVRRERQRDKGRNKIQTQKRQEPQA